MDRATWPALPSRDGAGNQCSTTTAVADGPSYATTAGVSAGGSRTRDIDIDPA